MFVKYLILICCTFTNGQFIFDTFKRCTFKSGDDQVEVNRVWDFMWYGKNIVASPCQSFSAPTNCKVGSKACVISNGKAVNAGDDFVLLQDEESGEMVLKSTGGDRCDADRYYQLIIHFQCTPNMKAKGSILFSNDCEYHMVVPDINCDSIKCTTNVNGNLIDFQDFKNNEIQVQSGNKTYFLSLCGPAKSCNRESSVCEKYNGKLNIIGSVKSQRVAYRKGELEILSNFGSEKRWRIYSEIHLKCNWASRIGKAEYIVPPTQGKTYKFQIVSAFGCMKLPMTCALNVDSSFYNLSSLNRPTSGWPLNNDIILNMCGPLQKKTPCPSHSQICRFNNPILDYGSVLTRFEPTDSGVIAATLSYGSPCPKNAAIALNTDITFQCALKEKGPILSESKDCSLSVTWETPAACPTHVQKGENCYLVDLIGYRNLSGIRTAKDRVIRLSQNSFIKYNFCGNLTGPCAGQNASSACLVANNEEFVLGYESKTIMSINGDLTMKLTGEKCKNYGRNSSLSVNFLCDYKAVENGVPNVNVLADNCDYNMTIVTPLACGTKSQVDCRVDAFDLSPLSLSNRNWVVKDGNLEYIINVCRPVVTSPTSLCPFNSSICLRNLSEANIEAKYSSLGKLQRPYFRNGQLAVEYNFGRMSANLEPTVTSIKFKCGSGVGRPVLVKKETSRFEFSWRSKYACRTADLMANDSPTLEVATKNSQVGISGKESQVGGWGIEKIPGAKEPTELKLSEYYETTQINQDCFVENNDFRIYVREVKPLQVSTKNSEFFLGSNGTCSGHLCRNGEEIVPLYQFCPQVVFNSNDKSVDLIFKGYKKCGLDYYNFTMKLKCNSTEETPVITESHCEIELVYPMSEACRLLPSKGNSVGLAIGLGTGIPLIISISIAFIFWKCKRKGYEQVDKSRVPIYVKDTTT